MKRTADFNLKLVTATVAAFLTSTLELATSQPVYAQTGGDAVPLRRFVDEHATRIQLDHELLVYSLGPPSNQRLRGWYFLGAPRSSSEARDVYAIPQSENIDTLRTVTLPRGLVAYLGEIQSEHFPGGARGEGSGGGFALWIPPQEISRNQGRIRVVETAQMAQIDDANHGDSTFTSSWQNYASERTSYPNNWYSFVSGAALVDNTRLDDQPGAVLDAGTCTFDSFAVRTVRLETRDSRVVFIINDSIVYDPWMSSNELNVLYRADQARSTTNENISIRVDGTSAYLPMGSEPAANLRLADNEVGAYVFGYDQTYEIWRPRFHGYVNPFVETVLGSARLERTSVWQYIWENSCNNVYEYIKMERLKFCRRGADVFPCEARIAIHLSPLSCESSAGNPQPGYLHSARWTARNLAVLITRSRALQRFFHYSATVSFFRNVRRAGVRVEGVEGLTSIGSPRVLPDYGSRPGPRRIGMLRQASLSIESSYITLATRLDDYSAFSMLQLVILYAASASDGDVMNWARRETFRRASVLSAESDVSIRDIAIRASAAAESTPLEIVITPYIASRNPHFSLTHRELARTELREACNFLSSRGVDVAPGHAFWSFCSNVLSPDSSAPTSDSSRNCSVGGWRNGKRVTDRLSPFWLVALLALNTGLRRRPRLG